MALLGWFGWVNFLVGGGGGDFFGTPPYCNIFDDNDVATRESWTILNKYIPTQGGGAGRAAFAAGKLYNTVQLFNYSAGSSCRYHVKMRKNIYIKYKCG